MSLYAEYIKEREGKHIIESDKGFATFIFNKDSCYIEDIFVVPMFRHEHVASQMADKIVELAKAKGLTKVFGSVVPTANHSTDSLKVLISYGFTLNSSSNNFILMEKAI